MIEQVTGSTVFRRIVRLSKPVRHFLWKFLNDWSLNFAAMLAYNLLISLLPMFVALFGIFGLVLKQHPDAQREIKDSIVNAFAHDNVTYTSVRQVVDLAFSQLSSEAGGLLVIGILLSLFGASRLFVAIDKCMSIIYRVPERTFLRENLVAFGALFVFIIMVPVMLAVSSAPSVLMSVFPSSGHRVGTFTAGVVFSLLAAFILFEVMYWLIPNKTMSLRTTWPGALVASCILELFVVLFPLYVAKFMGNYTGQIGFIVILLLFFYYFAAIILLGAQINAFFLDNYPPFDDGLGTYISHMHEAHGVKIHTAAAKRR